jgi:hypothetical protein
MILNPGDLYAERIREREELFHDQFSPKLLPWIMGLGAFTVVAAIMSVRKKRGSKK